MTDTETAIEAERVALATVRKELEDRLSDPMWLLRRAYWLLEQREAEAQ